MNSEQIENLDCYESATALAAIIEGLGLTFQTTAHPRKKNDIQSPMAFQCFLTKGTDNLSFEYSAGVGHAADLIKVRKSAHVSERLRMKDETDARAALIGGRCTLHTEAIALDAIKRYKPKALDAVSALLSDMQCLDGYTFRDEWLTDMCYTESMEQVRTGEKAWATIQDRVPFLRTIFGDKLSTALHLAAQL